MTRGLKLGVAVLALIVCAAAAWFYGSPYWTLRQMATAAEQGDVAAFTEYVDLKALRADVVADLRLQAERQLDKLGETPFEELGRRFMAGIGAAVAARIAEPDYLMERFARERRSELVLGERSLSTFWLLDRSTGKRRFLFRRDGLGWKLSGTALEDVRI